jgi:hypothetical protein
MMTRVSRGLERRNYARDGLARLSLSSQRVRRRCRLRRLRNIGFTSVLLRDACRLVGTDSELRCLRRTCVPRASRVPRPGLMTRSLMLVCDWSPEGLNAEGYLRRKPIPLELFLR